MAAEESYRPGLGRFFSRRPVLPDIGSMRSCGVAPNHIKVELERAAA
jgi:hypothetical protein